MRLGAMKMSLRTKYKMLKGTTIIIGAGYLEYFYRSIG
jgi:hypothetical protein